MAERIAHGVVEIEVNDRDALARLHKLQAEFEKAMADIDRQKAEVDIDADIAPFKDAVDNCKREIKKFQGIKATAELDADAEKADLAIKKLKAELKDLEGQKAEVELKVKADTSQLKAAEARAAAAKKALDDYKKSLIQTNQLEEKYERDRLAAVRMRAKVSTSLERQRVREMNAAHAEAIRMDKERTREIYKHAVGIHEETRSIIAMQRQYAKLTDRLEALSKAHRTAFGRERKAKIELDAKDALLQMEILKKKLGMLGAHPPVDIKANIDERGLSRVGTTLRNIGSIIGNKLAGLADATVRIGPFTTSVRGLTAALAVLGPTIFDVAGALGALVGVAGGGIMGAGAIAGGGLVGAISGFGGLALSARTAAADFKVANQATSAYTKAVLKYGASSKEAKTAQDQMNSVLKSVSPLAREAAVGMSKFQTNWDKLTKPTQRDMGGVARSFFRTLNQITPQWAAATNKLSAIMSRSLEGAFKFLRSGEAAKDFKVISDNFATATVPMMHALGSLGRAFLNFAREGSKFLPDMAKGFDSFATSVLRFTQKGDFAATIKRWVDYAKDLTHFLGAAGRVLIHFFGAGSAAGDDLVNTMTNALNRWDRFIQSAGGHQKIADFFKNSADGATELYHALQPIIGLFSLWAIGLEPAVKTITQIFAGVTHLVQKLGELVGLGNPLNTLGVTLGALWSVSKIGAFVATLGRIPAILREIKAAQGGLGLLRELTSGRLLGRIRDAGKISLGGSIEAAGGAAAAEMRQGIISGGTAAAAELRAAMSMPGVPGIPGGKGGPGGIIKTGEKAGEDLLKVAGGAAAAETAATTATAAVGGLSLASAALATGATLAAGSLVYLGIKIATTQTEGEKWHSNLKDTSEAINQNATDYDKLISSYGNVRGEIETTTKAVKEADRALARTRPGTKAHEKALNDLKNAQTYQTQAVQHWKDQVKQAQQVANDDVRVTRKQLTEWDKHTKALMDRERAQLAVTKDAQTRQAIEYALGKQEAARERMLEQLDSAQNRAAASGANMARVYKGLRPLVGSAEQALGRLARTAGKKITTEVAVKYANPTNAARVAGAAQAAIQSGVKTQVAMKVIADTKTAEAAIRRLNALRLDDKRLAIIEHGGKEALRIVEQIQGKKLNPKQQDIIEHGGAEALALLRRLIGTDLPSKNFNIKAVDYASSVIGRIQAYLASIPREVVVHMRSTGRVGPLATNATGGIAGTSNPTTKPGLTERAARAAASRSTARAEGVFNAPRFLVGEERRPEVVISSNPAYRKRNLGYLGIAARMLGAGLVTAAAGFAPSTFGKFVGSEFHPEAKLKRSKVFKPSKKNKKPFSIKRGWADYIDGLQTQQGLWEREVSLRESTVREPEDMVIEGPKIKVKDPETGKNVEVPTYVPNPKIESEYKPDLANVLDAMRTLMSIIAELVRAIPEAMAAAKSERHGHNVAIGNLNDEIDKEKGRLKADPKHADKHKKRIQKLEDQRDKHKTERDSLTEALDKLGTDRVTAGLDYREADIARASMQAEYDSVAGKAAASAAQQSEDALPKAPEGDTGPDQLSASQLNTLAGLTSALGDLGNSFTPADLANSTIIGASGSAQSLGGATPTQLLAEAIQGGAGVDETLSRISQSLGAATIAAQSTKAINATFAPYLAQSGSRTAGIPGSVGGGSGPTVIINTLHPGDPRVAQALATTAAKGFRTGASPYGKAGW